MSSLLFNKLKTEFQQQHKLIDSNLLSTRPPITTTSQNANTNKRSDFATTPPDSINICYRCPQMIIYNKSVPVIKNSDLSIKAVYPRPNPSSLTTRRLQDIPVGPESRFIGVVPPVVPPPYFLQEGYVKYRDTNEPASRIPTLCNGLSNKKWDTS